MRFLPELWGQLRADLTTADYLHPLDSLVGDCARGDLEVHVLCTERLGASLEALQREFDVDEERIVAGVWQQDRWGQYASVVGSALQNYSKINDRTLRHWVNSCAFRTDFTLWRRLCRGASS